MAMHLYSKHNDKNNSNQGLFIVFSYFFYLLFLRIGKTLRYHDLHIYTGTDTMNNKRLSSCFSKKKFFKRINLILTDAIQ